MKKKAIIAALLLGVAGGAALAQGGSGRDGGLPQFQELDVDGDGAISAEDLTAFRQARFASMDTNEDGTVSRDEFVTAHLARAGERAGQMFDRLDVDGDGALSEDAIAAERGGRGPDPSRMIARLDTDGDGVVSEEEFSAAMSRRAEARGRFGKHGHGARRN